MTKKIPHLWFQSEESRKPGLLAALLDDGSLSERLKKYNDEDTEKLLMLCQYYGIENSPFVFYELALVLAREIYPEPKKRGRKSKWTLLNKGALVVEIERLVRPDDPSHGVEWACTRLAKSEPWASFLETKESGISSSDPAEALRKIYFSFRKDKWADISRSAFKMYEHEGPVALWDSHVIDVVKNPHPK